MSNSAFNITQDNALKTYEGADSIFAYTGTVRQYMDALGIPEGKGEFTPLFRDGKAPIAIIRNMVDGTSAVVALSTKFDLEKFQSNPHATMIGMFENEDGTLKPVAYISAGSSVSVTF